MGRPSAPTTARVVSLVPSATESLLAWGVVPVACTRFCEQPSLPHVGGTKDPDVDAIVALGPDLVVLCEEENRRPDAEALVAAGLDVHVLAIEAVDDVAPALVGLAERLALDPVALEAAGLTGRVEVGPLPAVAVRAFVPIWRRPWMALGPRTYGASLLASVGVDVVAPDVEDRYPPVALDQVADLGAEVVLAPSEPYPFGPRHHGELAAVAPVVPVDGQDLFWWGVRTPAARRRLADALAAAGAVGPRR